MSINLVTYANQTVTPTNDAIIYEKAVDQNGIFYGCNVTVTSNTVNITGGYGLVCGREFVINSESITVTLAPSGTLQGRLYVRLDLADADAPIQLLTATGNTLPPLEQDSDVNYTNGTYEMELATFTVGVSSLSDVVETFEEIKGTKSDLTLNTFTISNPAMYTNGAGGYYKRGNVVFVNARVYVRGTLPANDYSTVSSTDSFPRPVLQSGLNVTWNYADSSSDAKAVISPDGGLVVQSGSKALSASTIYITGAYIAL